ncbi:MAG TPA: hypothetical protein PLI08_13645, partial [Bacteroidia bacterium]|nr:hypothetical protein [Bacteroidia bacterium]
MDSDDDCQDSSTYEQFNGRQSPLRYQKRKMLVGDRSIRTAVQQVLKTSGYPYAGKSSTHIDQFVPLSDLV